MRSRAAQLLSALGTMAVTLIVLAGGHAASVLLKKPHCIETGDVSAAAKVVSERAARSWPDETETLTYVSAAWQAVDDPSIDVEREMWQDFARLKNVHDLQHDPAHEQIPVSFTGVNHQFFETWKVTGHNDETNPLDSTLALVQARVYALSLGSDIDGLTDLNITPDCGK